MEGIVLRLFDRSGKHPACSAVTSDTADFEAIEFFCFPGQHKPADLVNGLRLGMFQKRRMARETRHRRLRIFSRLLSDRLEILGESSDKIIGRQRARVK